MPLQFYAFDVLTLAGGSLQNQRLVACNVENDSGLSYRNEAGRPPPNLPLVRGRDFRRYRFQCYSPLVRRFSQSSRTARSPLVDRAADDSFPFDAAVLVCAVTLRFIPLVLSWVKRIGVAFR